MFLFAQTSHRKDEGTNSSWWSIKTVAQGWEEATPSFSTAEGGPNPHILARRTPHHQQEEMLTRELGEEPTSRPHGENTSPDLLTATSTRHKLHCRSPWTLNWRGKLPRVVKGEEMKPRSRHDNDNLENNVKPRTKGPGTKIWLLNHSIHGDLQNK